MLDILKAALLWSAEYQNWGWNSATLGSVMMLVLTPFETWGIARQAETIWNDEKGDAVSNSFMLFGVAFYFVVIVFGIHQHSIAMLINAVACNTAQIAVLAMLLKFKGFTRLETALGAGLMLMPVWQTLTANPSEWYFVFSFGLWLSLAAQLKELWDAGKTGELDGRMVSTMFLAAAGWTIFIYSGEDFWFKISQVGIFAGISSVTILWCWYKYKEQQARKALP